MHKKQRQKRNAICVVMDVKFRFTHTHMNIKIDVLLKIRPIKGIVSVQIKRDVLSPTSC